MANFDKLKVGVAGLALAAAAGAANAQSASPNGLSAREACKQIATSNFSELPATGKGFATGGSLACEFTRVGNAYAVTRTYDLDNPRDAQIFNSTIQMANRMEQVALQRQTVQQQREDIQNSPLRQAQEAMRDAQQGANVLRQGQNILRSFGIGR